MATARSLSAVDLTVLMRDPLLRSTGALRGLFHRAVVITEADSDRAFYDEANRRLQDQGRGVPDALWINAQNWQTIPRVMSPLRRLGIPAAAIIDLDTLTEGGPWGAFYDAIAASDQDRASLEASRAAAEAELRGVGPAVYKPRGTAGLSGNARAIVENCVQALAAFGVFVVPVGELEGWLASLGVARGRKRDWIVATFAALGSDPSGSGYVQPGEDDVWAFLDGLRSWSANVDRQGIP